MMMIYSRSYKAQRSTLDRPIRSPALEATHNQEIQLEAAMEDDRGRSTADTFNNIKKMELGASTIVTSGIELSQVQELQQMTEK